MIWHARKDGADEGGCGIEASMVLSTLVVVPLKFLCRQGLYDDGWMVYNVKE